MTDYGDLVAKLRSDQLVCAITGMFAAIGHEPELTPTLADRGRLAALELRKRLPRRRRGASAMTMLCVLCTLCVRPSSGCGRSPLSPGRAGGFGSVALFSALAAVESGGRDLAPYYDRNGLAIGRYSIHREFAEDVGRDWARCIDPAYAAETIRRYWRKYGATTNEQRARLLNGGPGLAKSPATIGYWKAVQKRLNHGGTETRRRRR